MCMYASTSRVAAPPLPIPKCHAATKSRVQRHVSHRTDAPFPTHLSRPPDRAVRPTPNHTNINNYQDSYQHGTAATRFILDGHAQCCVSLVHWYVAPRDKMACLTLNRIEVEQSHRRQGHASGGASKLYASLPAPIASVLSSTT